jgi:hypothetical protein
MKPLIPRDREVIKNREFGRIATPLTRNQRVAFSVLLKTAYENMQLGNRGDGTFQIENTELLKHMGLPKNYRINLGDTKKGDVSMERSKNLDGELVPWEGSFYYMLLQLMITPIEIANKDSESGVTKAASTFLAYFKMTETHTEFQFSKWILDGIIEYDAAYIMELPIIASFKSTHSIALYDKLMQIDSRIKRWKVSPERLRYTLGLYADKKTVDERKGKIDKLKDERELMRRKGASNEDIDVFSKRIEKLEKTISEVPYAKTSDLNKHVLRPAVAEINEKVSGMNLEYEVIKEGRSVTFFQFSWGSNEETAQSPEESGGDVDLVLDAEVITGMQSAHTLKEFSDVVRQSLVNADLSVWVTVTGKRETVSVNADGYLYFKGGRHRTVLKTEIAKEIWEFLYKNKEEVILNAEKDYIRSSRAAFSGLPAGVNIFDALKEYDNLVTEAESTIEEIAQEAEDF